jgi:hypothetical protein
MKLSSSSKPQGNLGRRVAKEREARIGSNKKQKRIWLNGFRPSERRGAKKLFTTATAAFGGVGRFAFVLLFSSPFKLVIFFLRPLHPFD